MFAYSTRLCSARETERVPGIGPSISKKLAKLEQKHGPMAKTKDDIEAVVERLGQITIPNRNFPPRIGTISFGIFMVLSGLEDGATIPVMTIGGWEYWSLIKKCTLGLHDTLSESVSRLMAEGYIHHSKEVYRLVDKGISIGIECKRRWENRQVDNKTLESDWSLEAGTFDIVLLIDQREARSLGDGETLSAYFSAEKINFGFRTLPLGDFAWICRSRLVESREVALGYVVERKREDDLVASIVDGRFNEQRIRLANSNIRNIIYVVEKYRESGGRPTPIEQFGKARVLSALANMQVSNRFFVKWTSGFDGTLAYISELCKRLTDKYAGRSIETGPMEPIGECSPRYHCKYKEFSESNTKTLQMTQQELFSRQLACIKFMSPERLCSVLETYPTLAHLMAAYDAIANVRCKKLLLANMIYRPPDKKLGKKLSERIYDIFCGDVPTLH